MIKKIIFSLVISSSVFAQQLKHPSPDHYPKNYFKNPLSISNYLAANFGELRTNHFHSGLDIKTQQKEGLKILAAAEGYISRINVSPTGYGNALYINHPNGYTTVYAHLQKFSKEIQEYVRINQYKNESFSVELYPDSNRFPVTQGQFIALSGNSGGSGGPHLHFEVRDTKTEEPINPFFFGFDIPDHRSPNILGVYAYAVEGNVNGQENRILIANGGTIKASGTIGFGVKAYDKLDGAENNNGIYQINVLVNNEPIYSFIANRFSFPESRFVNSVCDYSDIQKNNSWVYQTFIKKGNTLRMFSNLKNNGLLELEDRKEYKVKISVLDYAGNKTERNFKVFGEAKPNNLNRKKVENIMYWHKQNSFKSDQVEVFFPKGVFYEDYALRYSKTGSKYRIGDENIPLHNYYTISIHPSLSINDLDKAVIIREYQKRGQWKKDYEITEVKNGKLITRTRNFGVFSIEIDNTKPVVRALNIKENSIFTSTNNTIRFTIDDSQSGIKEYKAYIDGKWVLAEYDKKIKRLSINLNQENIEIGNHKLELQVKDEKNNKAVFNATFKKNS